jgi:hypothetical protein
VTNSQNALGILTSVSLVTLVLGILAGRYVGRLWLFVLIGFAAPFLFLLAVHWRGALLVINLYFKVGLIYTNRFSYFIIEYLWIVIVLFVGAGIGRIGRRLAGG